MFGFPALQAPDRKKRIKLTAWSMQTYHNEDCILADSDFILAGMVDG